MCVCLAVFAGIVRVGELSDHQVINMLTWAMFCSSGTSGCGMAAGDNPVSIPLLEPVCGWDVVLQGIELHLLADSKQQQQ